MSTERWDGRLDLAWGGEERRFELRIGELRAIEAETGRGIMSVLQRIATRDATLDEVRAVLRYALEGGGEKPGKTGLLIKRYFDEQRVALSDSYAAAADVLQASLFLPRELSEAPKGKAQSDGEKTTTASPSL